METEKKLERMKWECVSQCVNLQKIFKIYYWLRFIEIDHLSHALDINESDINKSQIRLPNTSFENKVFTPLSAQGV